MRNPFREREIVGQRVVDEDTFFFYDRQPRRQRRCVHAVSVYSACCECAAGLPVKEGDDRDQKETHDA